MGTVLAKRHPVTRLFRLMAFVSSPRSDWRRCCLWAASSLVALAWFGASSLSAAPSPAAEPVDFNFQIRPLLSDRCFKCHGPDQKARKAKLRLDMADSAYAVRDPSKGTRAITPGHAE